MSTTTPTAPFVTRVYPFAMTLDELDQVHEDAIDRLSDYRITARVVLDHARVPYGDLSPAEWAAATARWDDVLIEVASRLRELSADQWDARLALLEGLDEHWRTLGRMPARRYF